MSHVTILHTFIFHRLHTSTLHFHIFTDFTLSQTSHFHIHITTSQHLLPSVGTCSHGSAWWLQPGEGFLAVGLDLVPAAPAWRSQVEVVEGEVLGWQVLVCLADRGFWEPISDPEYVSLRKAMRRDPTIGDYIHDDSRIGEKTGCWDVSDCRPIWDGDQQCWRIPRDWHEVDLFWDAGSLPSEDEPPGEGSWSSVLIPIPAWRRLMVLIPIPAWRRLMVFIIPPPVFSLPAWRRLWVILFWPQVWRRQEGEGGGMG